jgi:ABC-2 type transport system permease protein
MQGITAQPPIAPVSDAGNTGTYSRALVAILGRDVTVTIAELPALIIQVFLQPLFLVFVFGKVLPDLGYANRAYATTLVPGVVALTTVLTALQNSALPLVIEFGFTKDIEDRLMAPLPVQLVAVEKIVIGALRGLAAGAVIFPLSILIIQGDLHLNTSDIPTVIAMMILAAVLGSALGLTLGTLVPPAQINVVFSLVLTPLVFTGCTQYPWSQLATLRWFQIVTLLNPVTYASEGMRGALIPGLQHLNTGVCFGVLILASIIFSAVGIRSFRSRALD